jgi:hypothetical protein
MKYKIIGNPAVVIAALNSVVALLVSFGFPLSEARANAITVIATAVLGIVIAVLTRPILPATVAALVGTILTAVGAFGYQMSSAQIASIVAVVSLAAGFVIRQFVSPAPSVRALTYR